MLKQIIKNILIYNPDLELIKIKKHIQKKLDRVEKGLFVVYNHKYNFYELHSVKALLQNNKFEPSLTYQMAFSVEEFNNLDLVEWIYENSIEFNNADDMFRTIDRSKEIYDEYQEEQNKKELKIAMNLGRFGR